MSNMLLLIVQIVMLFLRNVKDHEKCPDGVCDEPMDLGRSLSAQLISPNVSIGPFTIFRFLRCFPMDRVLQVVKRIMALLDGCDRCPDGDCTMWDILSCIDIKEAVDIAKEILEIIKDSQICEGDGKEITLGEASL